MLWLNTIYIVLATFLRTLTEQTNSNLIDYKYCYNKCFLEGYINDNTQTSKTTLCSSHSYDLNVLQRKTKRNYSTKFESIINFSFSSELNMPIAGEIDELLNFLYHRYYSLTTMFVISILFLGYGYSMFD